MWRWVHAAYFFSLQLKLPVEQRFGVSLKQAEKLYMLLRQAGSIAEMQQLYLNAFEEAQGDDKLMAATLQRLAIKVVLLFWKGGSSCSSTVRCRVPSTTRGALHYSPPAERSTDQAR